MLRALKSSMNPPRIRAARAATTDLSFIEKYKLFQLLRSDYDGNGNFPCRTSGGLASNVKFSVVYASGAGYAFPSPPPSIYMNAGTYLISQGLGSAITSYPIYLIAYAYPSTQPASGILICKNASQTGGNTPAGRYLGLRQVGSFMQSDGNTTEPAVYPAADTWGIMVYARYANLGTQQRKRHFFKQERGVENQNTLSYTSNTDEFVINAGFSSRAEQGYTALAEVRLYDGTDLTDTQRDTLISTVMAEMKATHNI